MRPIKATQTHTQYPEPPTLTFTSANLKIVQSALGHTNAPRIDECLNLWLAMIPGSLVSPRNGVEKAVDIIRTKVDSIYKKAAKPLLNQYGEFCHFCETRLASTVDVEHRLPKAVYPDLSVSWKNFLLACGPCNRAKSAQPDRSEVQSKAAIRAGILRCAPPIFRTDTDFHDEIIDHQYVWPNVVQDSYQHLPAELQYFDDVSATWKKVPRSTWNQHDTRIVKIDLVTHEVTAFFRMLVRGGNFRVRVFVKQPISQSVTDYMPTRAEDTIDLCKLNQNSPTQAVSDRRVIHRTKTWFDALDALKVLNSVKSTGITAAYDCAFKLAGTTATASGFFSIWLTVFKGERDPNNQPLDARFVSEFTQQEFPGTETASLP